MQTNLNVPGISKPTVTVTTSAKTLTVTITCPVSGWMDLTNYKGPEATAFIFAAALLLEDSLPKGTTSKPLKINDHTFAIAYHVKHLDDLPQALKASQDATKSLGWKCPV
jgi:hypothetical protein